MEARALEETFAVLEVSQSADGERQLVVTGDTGVRCTLSAELRYWREVLDLLNEAT